MEIKGTYTLVYYSQKVEHELIIVVELRMIEGLMKPGQNVWEGFATKNGQPYDEVDLSHCVNAKLAAERIGLKEKQLLKENCKQNDVSFKIKKETIK